ncbi:MAG: type II secretion system protein [Sulfuricurvum sp.]|nr:type II secretion system protein [Sulfuricurvum sp.]MDP3022842.1 type II secretion system protein [Sulfuricurvum sp.]MDP3119296.1 type II secretion system protein [Sulfuricurvum sp.]
MKNMQFRNAFSMIELLFVIVIMGIVGGIALETIRQYYENIYRTQEYTKRVSQADHILDQVSKYFENAISSSIVNLDRGTNTGCYGPPIDGDTNDYTIAFVAPDQDTLRVVGTPGWSEDTLLMPNNELNASDANYAVANTVITALGSTLRNSAIYDHESANIGACARFNWDDAGAAGGYPGFHKLDVAANPISSTTIRLNADNLANDGKRKYLLRTGYAFRVQDNGNFTMYSNFRPWANQRYTAATKINVLGEKVAHFYADYDATDFMANDNLNDRGLVWRLKVCMQGLDADLNDSIAETQTICRERRVHVRY